MVNLFSIAKHRIPGAVVLALLLAGTAGAATSIFQFQMLDLTDVVRFQILQNGNVIFSDTQNAESYGAMVPLTAPTVGAISFIANIMEPGGGPLSDGYLVSAASGATTISVSFASDGDPVPVIDPLPGGQSIIETGGLQTIGNATLSDGSTLIFQFQSDLETPEPASMMLCGFGIAALTMSFARSRRIKRA
jgi:hypothetical protein